jgi:NitT/TauT family transport system ATP-binding protein
MGGLLTAASPPKPTATPPPPGSASAREVAVRIDHVTKVFSSGGDSVTALEDISLSVGRGEFVCILGASGCGKSTLLNLVADLDRPTSGTVECLGDPSFMFQESALFPWLNVERNVDLPLRLRKVPKAARKQRVDELLELVQLSAFARRQPHELSGGMRQRVALARSLAQEAEVLLMDEPFGALDAMTRDILHDELERIWQATGRTILFVTHNVREAVRLGDRVVLLTSRPGKVAMEFPVEIPRPRRIEDRDVAQLAGEITTRLREEVARHGR